MLCFLLLACSAPDADLADSSAVESDDTDLPADLNGTPPAAPMALPTFAARNQLGEPRTDADLLGHPSVLWFYPAAGTAG